MNLVFQYYMPYEANDAHLGGVQMPDWAKAGSESAKKLFSLKLLFIEIIKKKTTPAAQRLFKFDFSWTFT